MLNFNDGNAICMISGGVYNNEIIYIKDKNDKCCKCSKCGDRCGGNNKKCCKKCERSDSGNAFEIDDGVIIPLPKIEERGVYYVAGPSGSGKSTYASNLTKIFKKINKNSDLFIFSRTDAKNDPAFNGIKYYQIEINESIIDNPIDITELTPNCFILFDDCNTITNDSYKKAVDKLMMDILEIGRKLNISICITNHLVIPNERKIARTIMNEMQSLTVFPKSGSSQQIRYCLKTYFGFDNKQIDYILKIDSRWITINKNYPMNVLYEHGVFII